jgi:hypothetical protein
MRKANQTADILGLTRFDLQFEISQALERGKRVHETGAKELV